MSFFEKLFLNEEARREKALREAAEKEKKSDLKSATDEMSKISAEVAENREKVSSFSLNNITNIGTPTVGVVDEKFAQILSDKLDSINLEGEDYLELRDALQSLLGVPGMNENTAYISAFMTLKTKGLTKQKCLESIDYYVTELNKEKELFNSAQENKITEQVTSITDKIDSLNTENEELNAKILELTNKIQENSNTINELTIEAQTNSQALETERLNFEATLGFIVNTLETDKTKITNYLNNID